MAIPSRVTFELTEKQTELLADFFDQNEKDTGLIIGQFFESTGPKGFVEVGYVNGETGRRLLKSIGLDPNKLTPVETPGVFVDLD